MEVIVQSLRLEVRPFTESELDLFVSLYVNERVTRYMTKRSAEDCRQLFAVTLENYQLDGRVGRWGVYMRTDGELAGSCILKPADSAPDKIELGYVFAEKYWGLGLATELTEALIRYGFEQMQMTEICATTDYENEASQKVLIKTGFLREGSAEWHGRELAFFRLLKDAL